jgi:hypothetical protein
MLTMTGCDPQLNIAGAYIPAWLVCAIGGLFCFWVIHLIILKASILPFLVPVPLVYLAVIIACTCGLWLLFFATR